MATIMTVRGVGPRWGDRTFLAPNATIVGDVVMGNGCSVWFNAVIRGDVHSIRIGDETNIQDGAIIHCTYQKAATLIGSRVSIAHNAIVHGCTIHNDVLIGMGAIVMDGAVVESGAIVAAGAVVLQNTRVEAGYIYAGAPARKLKPVEGDLLNVFSRTATNYQLYATWYEEGLVDSNAADGLSNSITGKK